METTDYIAIIDKDTLSATCWNEKKMLIFFQQYYLYVNKTFAIFL